MQSLWFWKNWQLPYRNIFYAMAGLFILSVAFLWASYLETPGGVIHWEKLQEQKIVETTVHSFRLGPFELQIPGESYVILEYFNGSDITPNLTASYIFLAIFSLASVILITVISALERFWYYVGMALLMVFIVSLRFEVLNLFGQNNSTAIIAVLILYCAPSFYFNRFNTDVPFLKRLAVFTGITALLAIIIYFFAETPVPFFQMGMAAYTAALIVSVLFIIMIAGDIVAGFVYITTSHGSRSMRHLFIICGIYIINLFITALHELGLIHWNFIYINLYLLLTVSAVLGLWGFRNRESLYGYLVKFAPYGAVAFLALGAIAMATTGHMLASANDPALRIIRDAIIFSHTGYSFIFVLYVVSNFIGLLVQNRPIYKVLYSPRRMPYFTYRLAGLVCMLAFVLYSNWREYIYHGFAGLYNSAGDLYTMLDNEPYALSFYTQGASQAFQNHRSNYALGTLRASRLDYEKAHSYYEAANRKRPSEFSLVNDGNLYLWGDNAFGAIHAYRRALSIVPNSPHLENNLGFAYLRVHNYDSAIVFLSHAHDHADTRVQAETNFFALAALEMIPLNADSVLTAFNATSPGVLNNALALSTLFNTELKTPLDPFMNERLDLYSATLLNNYCVRYAKSLDTTFINRAYRIASDSNNTDYSEALKSSLAFAFYHRGNVNKALDILGELAYTSQSYQGKFNYIMGLWALEQNNPTLAASYFNYATREDYKNAGFYYAIAETEAGHISRALSAWDSVTVHGSTPQKAIATSMQRILTLPASEAVALTDPGKYQFCRYRIGLGDSVLFDKIVNTFTVADYKAQALLDVSMRYFEADQLIPAIRFFDRIAGLTLTDKNLYEQVRHAELRMLTARKELRALATQINKGVTFDQSQELEKLLYAALIGGAGGATDEIRKNYAILASYNPYFEEGILAAADFYRTNDKDKLKAYNVLANALQVNANSIRLLKAYIAEATRQGFDEYAASAAETLVAAEADTQTRLH